MKKIYSFSRIFALMTLLFVGLGSAWATSYTLVESAPQDWSGNYLLVAKNGDTYYAWDGTFGSWGSTVAVSNTELSNSNKTITPAATSTIQPITISAVTGGYTISDGTSYLASTDKKFNSSETAVVFGHFAIDNGNAIIQKTNNGSNDYGVRYNYNNGSGGFRVYKTQTTASAVYLYKADEAGDTRTAVNITSFTATTSELTLGGTTSTTTSVANDQNGWTAAYTYSSSNTNVATVNASGVVTAVADGTADITVSLNIANDDETWKKGATSSKKITITVVDPNKSVSVFNLSSNGYSWGSTNDGAVYFDGSTYTPAVEGDITLSVFGNVRMWGSSESSLRLYGASAGNEPNVFTYGKGSITLTAASGYFISKVEFEGTSLTFSPALTNNAWTGRATSITFEKGSSTPQIKKITVTYFPLETGSFSLTEIDGAGWGTYFTDFAFVMPENVEGRLMKDVEGTIKAVATYAAGTVVPANTGLLLKGTAGNYNVTETTTAATILATGNLLKGSVEGGTTTGGTVYYKLANDSEDGLGWYWGAANGAEFTCGAHKAYLVLDAAPSLAPAVIHITDETETATCIENIKAEQAVKFIENGQIYILKNGNVYNVAGQIIR